MNKILLIYQAPQLRSWNISRNATNNPSRSDVRAPVMFLAAQKLIQVCSWVVIGIVAQKPCALQRTVDRLWLVFHPLFTNSSHLVRRSMWARRAGVSMTGLAGICIRGRSLSGGSGQHTGEHKCECVPDFGKVESWPNTTKKNKIFYRSTFYFQFRGPMRHRDVGGSAR